MIANIYILLMQAVLERSMGFHSIQSAWVNRFRI